MDLSSSLYAAGKRQLRTKTNAFVVSLAVADFCVGMIAVPSRFFCEMTSECTQQARLFVIFVRMLPAYASGTNLCSLVFERYMAVVKPLKYLTFMKRRRVIQIISLSWGIPLTFTVIDMIPKIPLDGLVINGWLYVFFELILCIVLIFCLVSMLRVLCQQNRRDRVLAKQLNFNQRVTVKTPGKSAVKMMVIVTGVFLLCYGIFMRCGFLYVLGFLECNDFRSNTKYLCKL